MSVKTVPPEDYVVQLLAGKDFISSDDIPLSDDFDYVMSFIIVAQYDCETSRYRLEPLDGSHSRNGYSIPNMIIRMRS